MTIHHLICNNCSNKIICETKVVCDRCYKYRKSLTLDREVERLKLNINERLEYLGIRFNDLEIYINNTKFLRII